MSPEPLMTRGYDAHPAIEHERLRSKYGSVAPVDLLGVPVWFVLGYEEVLHVLQNSGGIWTKNPARWQAYVEGRIPADWPLLPVFQVDSSNFAEGAAQHRFRSAWTKALQPFQDHTHPQAKVLEQAIKRYADDLIGLLAEGGPTGAADLSAQYARPLPLMVANRMLGFSTARGDEVVMDIWRLIDAGPESAAAFERLYAAMMELAAQKREQPGDDLPSYMIQAQPDLTQDELARELLMLPALLDFCAGLVCNVVVEVVSNPAVRESLSVGAIDETVNRVAMLNPPMANLTFRFPVKDVKMGNYTIAAGDAVMLSVAAAHADPRFAGALDPHAIRSTRAHLAWGAGPHACLGQRLATQMATVSVHRLFSRCTKVKLALPSDQLPWRPSPLVRALRSLPIQYELDERRVPGAASAEAPAAQQSAEDVAAKQAQQRSPLWKFLRSLRFGR
ncbi:cytochrome P450 [Nonomuraea purpurea]|uniref:Cytochrome P450 n=1 Tax=Nonomuraea purpurea TaxID=1849276 RepID=A0ABV8GLW4_9ACTN